MQLKAFHLLNVPEGRKYRAGCQLEVEGKEI